jgi:DNA-binding response OmpR family regulator
MTSTIQKIMIIDNDFEYLHELSEFLIDSGFDVITRLHTDNIIQFIKLQNPDLIILDYKINGLSGIDVIKLIKLDLDTCTLPIILVSNFFDDDNLIVEVTNLGIDAFFKKAIKLPMLLEKITMIGDGKPS